MLVMFTGRGYGGPRRGRDFFRLRQQNTSRPPSMHVDDFIAIDNSLRPRKMDNRARGHKWVIHFNYYVSILCMLEIQLCTKLVWTRHQHDTELEDHGVVAS